MARRSICSWFAPVVAAVVGMAVLPAAAAAAPPATPPAPRARVGELVEQRTATSRTVAHEDGSRTTSVFGAPVHYRDARGAWQAIDTAMVATRAEGYSLVNGANRFRTWFKDRADADFARVDVDGRSLRFSLLDADDGGRAAHARNGVTYPSVYPGVDARYETTPDGVKETFVLAHASVPQQYRMALRDDRGDLTATKQSDGSWAFRTPTGDGPLFVLEAPHAVDSARAGEVSPVDATNARLDVAREGDRFVLTTTIDDVWLRAPERRFPVLLDPTLTIQPTVDDANFNAGCATCTPAIQDKVYAGSGTATWRGAMQFDLSPVPAGAAVTDARLGLFFERSCITVSTSWCNGTDHTVNLHRMTNAWTRQSVTSEIAFDPAVLSSVTVPYDAPRQWFAWPMTATVANWLAGTQPNHGLIIKRNTEAVGTSGPAFPGSRFTAEPSIQPKIDITYTSDAVELSKPAVLHADGAELRWARYTGPTGAPFDRYEVHRGTTAGFIPSTATKLATIRDISVTSYRDTTAAPNATFTYKVVANTAASNPRTVTLPADGQASIELQPGPDEGKANYLYYSSSLVNCANYGTGPHLWVGSDATRRYRPIISWDLRAIPAGAPITSATMSLWQTGTLNVGPVTVRAYRVTRAWEEGAGYETCSGDGVTWYDAAAGVKWASQGGDFDPAGTSPVTHQADPPAGWDAFDVKGFVEQWSSGTTPNLGILLKSDDESHIEGKDYPYISDDFTGEPGLRPKLLVTYADGSHAEGPTVDVDAPTAGAQLTGTTVPLQASAGDDRRVDKVEFLVGTTVVGSDTTEPFSMSWNSTTVSNGTHAVTARATDDAGNVTTSAPVSVVVENTPPPTVALSAPSSGATVTGNVTVSATASSGRTITRVEFFADDQRFGESTTAPYSATWNTLDATQPAYDGTRTLTAKAYDDTGQVTTSAARSVTVANTSGTKYRAGLTTTTIPATVSYDPALGTAQERQGVDVTILNNASTTMTATDVKLHYRWYAPGADPATGAGITTSPPIALPGDIRSNRSAVVRALVDPPVLGEGIDRSQYRLQFDLKDAAGNWFAAKGNQPSDNWVIVNKALSTALGFERYYHYDGAELGGGVEHATNVANGNSLLHWRPFESPGRGVSTVVDLTYNSLEQRSESPAGNNVSLTISGLSRLGNPIQIHPNNADTIAGRSNRWIGFTDADGTLHRFEGATTGTGQVYWKEPPGVNLYLRQFSTTDLARTWAFTRPDGVTFFYDNEGFPTSVEDANGNRLTFTLETTPPGEDPGGPKKRVTRVTDAAGQGATPAPNRSFAIDYWSKAEAPKAHQRGRIQRLTDHNGSALDFAYYEDGNLLRITQRGGTSADGITVADRSWVFTYTTSAGDGPAIGDAAARVEPNPRTPNQSSRLFSVRDPRGGETTFTYFGPTSGQHRWRLASRTDRDGTTTSYSYNVVDRVATVAAPLGRTSTFAYGSDGSVTSMTAPNGDVTAVTWTNDRRPARVTAPNGSYTDIAYNANGYVTGTWDELRNHTALEYDNVAVDANDVAGKWAANQDIPHISRLARKTEPRGTATSTPADDHQWQFTYDAKGNLLTATNPDNGVTTNTYNADGTLATTKDPNLHVTKVDTYDANGLPTKVTDAKGQVTVLAYNDDGLLSSVQDAVHAAEAGAAVEEYRSRYYYDPFHRAARSSEPKSTRHDRGVLVWAATEYDANDNPVADVGRHYGTRFTGNGPRTTAAYDAMDRPTLVTGPDTSADPAGERIAMSYDAAGRLVRVTQPKGVATTSLPDDFTERREYDTVDRVIRQSKLEGAGATTTPRITHYCYDQAGDLRRVTAPKAGLGTVDCAAATPPPHTALFEYDLAHRLLATVDAEGRRTSTTYDANGNVVSSTDGAGVATTMAYDERDLLTSVTEPLTTSPVRNLTTRYEYDKAGNRTRVVSPRAWDASADKVTFTDYVTATDYDAVGQPVRVRLPKAGTEQQLYVHQTFDAVGRVVATTLPDPADAEAAVPASKRTSIEYFDPGWVRTSDTPAAPRVHFDYTAEGLQSSRTPEDASGNQVTSQTMAWTYYVDGKLKERKDRGGHVTTYLYDANNRMTEATNAAGLVDGSQSPIEMVAEYDSLNRPSKVHHHRKADPATAWKSTVYAYDPNGNLQTRHDDGTETRDATSKAFVQTAAGQRHDFTYDGADWLTQVWDHGRTALHDSDDLRTTTAFSPTGRERQRTIEAGTSTAGWTPRQTTTWDHFANGKLRELVTKNGAGTVVEQHTVGYEEGGVYVNGHRTTDTFMVKGPDAAATCYSSTCVARYTYDARDRLTREDNGRGAVTNFTLDTAGNIVTEAITKGGSTQTRTSTFLGDRLQTLSTGTSAFKYLYDLDGNTDCVTTTAWSGASCPAVASGGSVAAELVADYAYDYLNRLRSFRGYAAGAVQDSAEYVHDPLDRNAQQTESHGVGATPRTTTFGYLGLTSQISQEEQSQSGLPNTSKSYSYDAFGHRTAMSRTTGSTTTTSTYGYDVHGSVSLLLGKAADPNAAEAAYAYRPYGEKDVDGSRGDTDDKNPVNPFRYSAKRFDSGTGTIDMGARRFGPDVSRFLQQDQFEGALDDLALETDPLTQNRYGLAGGNPIGFVEWDGHTVMPDGMGGGSSTPSRTCPIVVLACTGKSGGSGGSDKSSSWRSWGNHMALTLESEARRRPVYQGDDMRVGREADRRLALGHSEQEVAEWAVEARNRVRAYHRNRGDRTFDMAYALRRGAWDYPTYEMLRKGDARHRPKTDAQIIESARRTNVTVDKWAPRMKWLARGSVALDAGIGAHEVATAKPSQRARVAAREAGRMTSAAAGGFLGAKLGAAIGTAVVPFVGTGAGLVIGGVLGAVGGFLGASHAGDVGARAAESLMDDG